MKTKLYALIYLLTLIAISLIHSPLILLLLFALIFLSAKGARWHILKRALLVILFFNGAVTIGYLLYGLFAPTHPESLWLINIRSFTLTYLTFTFLHFVDLHRLFAFSKKSAMFYAFTYAQIKMLEKLFLDYKEGIQSRSNSIFSALKSSQLESLMVLLFGTMLHKSDEQTKALRSRGFFDD